MRIVWKYVDSEELIIGGGLNRFQGVLLYGHSKATLRGVSLLKVSGFDAKKCYTSVRSSIKALAV